MLFAGLKRRLKIGKREKAEAKIKESTKELEEKYKKGFEEGLKKCEEDIKKRYSIKSVNFNAWALYLKNQYFGVMKPINVMDGSVRIEDKRFDCNQAHPILVQKGMTAFPLYLLRWDSQVPAEIHFWKTKITPKLYKTIEETRVLQELFQRKRFTFEGGEMIIIGIIIGAILLFLFGKLGLVPT